MLAIGVIVAYLVYIAGAVAAMLVPVAAILFVVGRSEAAARALLYSLVLAVISVSGYGIVTWIVGGGEGAGVSVNEYVVAEPPKFASLYYPVEIYVIPIKEAQVTYKVRVEWGDGLVSEAVSVAPRMVNLTHSYNATGLYNVTVYIYEAESAGPSPGQIGWGDKPVKHESFVVNVSAPWIQFSNAIYDMASKIKGDSSCGWFDWECYFRVIAGVVMEKLADIFRYVSDFINRWMAEHGFYAGYAFYYYVAVPDTANFPAINSVYYAVVKWALLLLPIALIINIMWRAYWEFEREFSLLDIGREFVWVLFVILAGIYVYDAAAAVVNTVSLSLAQLGQLSSLYGSVLAFLVTTAAIGVVSPVAANIAAIGIAALLFLVLGGVLKWVLVAALVAAIPILAVIWLIPPLRGVASMFASILSGLMVFTLVAAVFARLIGELSNSFTLTSGWMNLIYAIVAPIVFAVAAPMVMQMIGGAAGGFFLPSLRHMLAGAVAMTAATGGAGAGAAAAAGVGGGPPPGAGGAAATSSVGVMAPVVGTTVLQNPVAQRIMQQRIMHATAPTTVAAAGASKMIREVKHPRLETAYHIATAITGKPPEYELSRKEKVAYYALKYTVGRTIRNIRQAANTFRHRFYMETGIWIPGRLPREHEIRKAAEITAKAGKWIGEKGVRLIRKVSQIREGYFSTKVDTRIDGF